MNMFLQSGQSEKLEVIKPDVIAETMKGWIPGLINFGIRLFIAVLIILIGSRLIKVLERILKRSFERMDMEVSLRKFLLSLINAGLYCILIFIAAGQLGVNNASIVAILGSAGLALSLALQGSLANFAGGILILVMKPFRVGDYIIADGGEGTVKSIGLVYTTMSTPDNRRVIIPNGNLANSPLTNVTAQDKRRVDILVGVSYSSDLCEAKKIIYQLYENHPMVLKEEIVSFVDTLGDHTIIIGGRGWVMTENYWSVKWEITENIKLKFDEAGIEIPFNQLDVHMK